MSAWGVVVAAGSGTRFGGPKHEVPLAGVSLFERARNSLLEAGVDEVVLVGPVPGGVPGGPTRRDSVAAGLARVPPSADWVLVHDAARPLATSGLAGAVLGRLRLGDVDAVVPVVPVRDTIKVVVDDRVVRTVDRSKLVAVQTPQGFRADVLRAAHGSAGGRDATDDAALVEAIGGTVVTVPGDPTNLKITYPEDLVLAEAVLVMRAER